MLSAPFVVSAVFSSGFTLGLLSKKKAWLLVLLLGERVA
jgi:hypothetical protein